MIPDSHPARGGRVRAWNFGLRPSAWCICPPDGAEMWWKLRRPEIIEEFDREVVGRVPKKVPRVTWRVNRTEEFRVDGRLGGARL